MAKKNLCMVGFNYGTTYQGFIPFYIYSIQQAYPEYDVRVFSDMPIREDVQKVLHRLEERGGFEVIGGYDFRLGVDLCEIQDSELKCSYRWLFYDDRFDDYEAVYIGDTDILICPEPGGIFETHMTHCKALGLPYSNYRRLAYREFETEARHPTLGRKGIAQLTLGGKLEEAKVEWESRRIGYRLVRSRTSLFLDSLSGLHFIIAEPYYRAVRESFASVFDEYLQRSINGEPISNENLLFSLMLESGLGVPPLVAHSKEADNRFPHSTGFRPWHGIHLGIFRGSLARNMGHNYQIVNSAIYAEYYRWYERLKHEDSLFEDMINSADPLVAKLFDALDQHIDDLRKPQQYRDRIVISKW
jgi:hypothetical protein